MTRFEVVYVLGIATGLLLVVVCSLTLGGGFAMSEAARALWSLVLLVVLVAAGWVLLGLAAWAAYELFLVGWGLFQ